MAIVHITLLYITVNVIVLIHATSVLKVVKENSFQHYLHEFAAFGIVY